MNSTRWIIIVDTNPRAKGLKEYHIAHSRQQADDILRIRTQRLRSVSVTTYGEMQVILVTGQEPEEPTANASHK